MQPNPTQQTIQYVITSYVQPARKRGEQTLNVRVGNVQKELGWTNRTPSIFSTLGSRKFQSEAGVELIDKRGGPPSGGPSTTVQFVYRILRSDAQTGAPTPSTAKGTGLLELTGILADAFESLGGGQEYLRRERAELHFPVEGYPNLRKSEHE